MFDDDGAALPGWVAPPSNADLTAWRRALATSDPSLDDAARLERIHRLEQLRAAVAAAQAVETLAFAESRRAVAKAEILTNPIPGVGTRRRLAEAEHGIVSDVATMRRISPYQAARFLSFATTATTKLPISFAAHASGDVSEKRLEALQRATTWLAPDLQRTVDAEIAPHLTEWGDARVESEARAAAYRLDQPGACQRIAAAERDRRVSLRPAPEAMAWLGMLVPLAQGVASWAALDRAARQARAAGDPRSRGQVMADTAVELLTGQARASEVSVAIELVMTDRTLIGETDNSTAGDGECRNVVRTEDVSSGGADNSNARDDVTIDDGCSDEARYDVAFEDTSNNEAFGHTPNEIASEDTCHNVAFEDTRNDVASDHAVGTDVGGAVSERAAEPDLVDRGYRRVGHESDSDSDIARIVGFGPVPGEWARQLALGDNDVDQTSAAARSVRRLFTDPAGQIVAMESRSRTFTPGMARLIRIRDDRCRTPWCDAPIRHIDHIHPAAQGGPTALYNGRGLCERCNYAAQAPRITVAPAPTSPPGMFRPDRPDPYPDPVYINFHTRTIETPLSTSRLAA